MYTKCFIFKFEKKNSQFLIIDLKFWDERNNYFYNIIIASNNYSVTIKEVLQQYLKKITV